MGFIDENVLATFLSMQTGLPCVSLANVYPSEAVLALLPADLARRSNAIPLKRVEDAVHVALADPTDPRLLEELSRATRLRIYPLVAPASAIARALDAYYGSAQPQRKRPGARAGRRPRTDLAAEVQTLERAVQTLQQVVARLKEAMDDGSPGSR